MSARRRRRVWSGRCVALPTNRNSVERLGSGVSFDRVEALSRLSDRDPDDLLLWTDVAGVHREAAKQARITADTETRTAEDRFLVMQPSFDESWWKGWFGLDGTPGAMVDKILVRGC